jgi:hypothetical protein
VPGFARLSTAPNGARAAAAATPPPTEAAAWRIRVYPVRGPSLGSRMIAPAAKKMLCFNALQGSPRCMLQPGPSCRGHRASAGLEPVHLLRAGRVRWDGSPNHSPRRRLRPDLFVLSANFWAGMFPTGRVNGQVTQSASTCTPSPAVVVVAALATLTTAYWARPTNARNPRRPAVPLWGGDIPRTPGCSLDYGGTRSRGV